MKYSTPELIVVGEASALVQGGQRGKFDNVGSDTSQPMLGTLLGLDE